MLNVEDDLFTNGNILCTMSKHWKWTPIPRRCKYIGARLNSTRNLFAHVSNRG